MFAKLDNTLFIVRICCLCFCLLALLMYIGNDHIPINSVTKLGLAALAIQIAVSSAELGIPPCFGLAPLPNNLRLSLLIVLLDFLAASFVVAVGWANIGVFIQQMEKGACVKSCKVSVVYGLLVLVGGALGEFGMLYNLAVAAKMNLQRQAQD